MTFTRTLLSMVHADVRRHMPSVRPMRAATVSGPSGKQFFVQITVDTYPQFNSWQKAEDAYEARAKAWTDFLHKYVPGYLSCLEDAPC